MRGPYDDDIWPSPVSPGKFPLWEEALVLLNRDIAATLPNQEPLQLRTLPLDYVDEPNVYVTMADGQWHGNRLFPSTADDAARALAEVADAAQETVTECLWQAWPVCTLHGLGMHPRDVDGELSWWCLGERARPHTTHIRAAVGALYTVVRVSRPNRKKRPAK